MEILQALKVDGHQREDHSGIIQFTKNGRNQSPEAIGACRTCQ